MLLQKTPSFMGALLSEFFQRLQDGGDSYASVFREFDKAVTQRTKAILPDSFALAIRGCFYEGLASSIASVPPAVTRRCGLQQWFVKTAAEHVISPAASSTVSFLKIRDGSAGKDENGYKFMNVVAAAAHCGLNSEASSMMFQDCMKTIISDGSTLKCEINYDEHVTLRQALSLLAITPDAFAGKRSYLNIILQTARMRAAAIANDQWQDPGYELYHLREIVVNNQCSFSPALGFENQEKWKIHGLKENMISQWIDRAGRFVLRSARSATSISECCPEILQALWNLDMEFGPADGNYVEGRPRDHDRLLLKIERERAKRLEWIDRFLAGIVAASRTPGQRRVVFSDEDAEQVRKVGQQHPALMLTIQDFISQMLAM